MNRNHFYLKGMRSSSPTIWFGLPASSHRRLIALAMSLLMLFSVLLVALHHHDDDAAHDDCSICAVAHHNPAEIAAAHPGADYLATPLPAALAPPIPTPVITGYY